MSNDTDFDFTKVKVKIEKESPPRKKEPEEIIDEIIPTLFNSAKSVSNKSNEIDDKKNIEPIKSSNEILAELFKVFNATPPKILLDDEILLSKKQKKKHKKEKKHKKKSRKRVRSGSDERSENENDIPKDIKHKKKKSKKSKHTDHHSKRQKLNLKEEIPKALSTTKIKSEEKNISEDSEFSISDYEETSLTKSPITYVRKIKIEKEDNYEYNKSDIKKSKDKEKTNFHKKLDVEKHKIKDDKNSKQSRHSEKPKKRETNSYDIKRDIESEISLSDEETYLKEKEKYNEYFDSSRNNDLVNRKKSDTKQDRDRYRENNEFYKGHTESRDRSSYRPSDRHQYSRSRWDRSRSRSYARSTSRSRELGIDKKRLLEIARKNAISMFKKGALPGTQQLSQDIKDKVLMKMRYGGKTVEDLTDFCKKLSNGENINELSDLSSNGDSDHDKDGNEKAFVHHPFVLKDRAPIVMNIKNSVPIQPKSAEETKALLMQFPVSSGQQHRLNESEWVPVPASKKEIIKTNVGSNIVPTAAKRMIQQQLSAQIPKTIFGKNLPADQKQLPAFVPLSQSNNSPTQNNDVPTSEPATATISENYVSKPINPVVSLPPPLPPPVVIPQPPIPIQTPAVNSISLAVPNAFNVPPPIITNEPPPILQPMQHSIFPQQHQNIDVSSIISKRLNAMRRLQENPMDAEALKIMYNAQKDMSTWASAKQVPGQFTGSTGVNVLSARELSGGVQAWAKRDQLMCTAPVSGGMGMQLLQKMGWKPGEGLGRERNGALQPLLLEVKLDKRGVMATEEDPVKRRIQNQHPRKSRKTQNHVAEAKKILENKHPVSLLGEIASKKHWLPPYYELVDDKGPSHSKEFIFKVVLNDIVYQPSVSSSTKKAAKAVAAKYCLQQMGVLSTTET